jgi:hypothetical protein
MAIDVWADTVQTAAVTIGAGAAMFAWRQVRLSRHGGLALTFSICGRFLQSDQARANRKKLYRAAQDKGSFVPGPTLEGPHSWTDDEIDAAEHVAQLGSVAGALAKHDYMCPSHSWSTSGDQCWPVRGRWLNPSWTLNASGPRSEPQRQLRVARP